MANITLILGTDSVSSSRVTINDNFANINQDLASIAGVLDTTNETITLAGASAFGSLNIASNKFIANSTGVTSTVPVTINSTFKANADVAYSIRKIGPLTGTTDLPAANAFLHSTYIVDSATINSVNLPIGNAGQEITIVANGGTLSVQAVNVSGATSISLADKATLTIRFAEGFWHIVSNHLATIL
jgi:hypothetical protein